MKGETEMFEKSRIAERLGIKNRSTEFYKEEAEKYIKDIGNQDFRRILWLLESITDQRASKIIETEKEMIHARSFDENRLGKLMELLQQYTEDFIFVYSLWQIYQHKQIELDAKGIAQFIKEGRLK